MNLNQEDIRPLGVIVLLMVAPASNFEVSDVVYDVIIG